MTFNPQRAEALRTAIHQTLDWLRIHPSGDTGTLLTEHLALLTEHLALLQEAELIYLTDAFVGEGEETGDSYSELLKKTYEPIFQAYIDPRKDEATEAKSSLYESLWRTMCTDMHDAMDLVQHNPEFFGAQCGDDKLKIIAAFFVKWANEKLQPDSASNLIFPDISELDRAAGRVNLRPTDPHAELRKTWAPGQRWQLTAGHHWADCGAPTWNPDLQYRRHPDDIDQSPKPWYPDDSGEWVEVPGDCLTCPVPGDTKIQYLLAFEREGESYTSVTCEADEREWDRQPNADGHIVAYKVVR